jgi:hypothetical protein
MAKLLKLEGDLENKKKKVDASRKDLKFKNPESIDQVHSAPRMLCNHQEKHKYSVNSNVSLPIRGFLYLSKACSWNDVRTVSLTFFMVVMCIISLDWGIPPLLLLPVPARPHRRLPRSTI